MANRRYLSRDSDGSDDDINKSVEKSDKTSEPKDSITSEDKVLNAKVNLNQLIDNLKSKTIFGESDPRLRDILAKPQRHIRRSARTEPTPEQTEEDINE